MPLKKKLMVAALALCGGVGSAQASDVNIGDYVALPDGTNVLLWYQQHGYYDQLRTNSGIKSLDGTHLRTEISVIRAIHYMEVGGVTFNVQAIVPFGHTYDVKVAGNKLNSDSGIADPIVGGTVWFINEPEAGSYGRYLGLTGLVYLPLGEYDKHQNINMGQNRWTGDFQLGWIEPLWGKSTLETHVGYLTFGDNDDFLDAGNNGKLEQDGMFNLQMNYVYTLSPGERVAVGFAKTTGGKQKFEGEGNGLKGGYSQWRLEYQRMLAPQWQLLGQVTHDFDVDGGFRKDYGLNFRLAYIF